MFNRRRFLVAASALPLTACKVRTINYFPVQDSTVRFLNVLPGPAALDVFQGGNATWSGIAFEGSTGNVTFSAQQTTFSVQLPGATDSLISVTAPLAGQQPYTLVAYGTVTAPQAVLLGDSTLTVPAGNVQLRIFDGAPGQSAVDFYLTAPGVPLDGLAPQFGNINYQNSTVFIQTAAGAYQLRLTITNTQTVVYDSGSRNYPEQTATDLVMYSRGSALLPNLEALDVNGALQQVVVNSTLARLKVVNLAFQTGTVNELLDGVAGVTALAYGSASAYSIVAQGSHVVSFEAAAVPGATIASVTTTLAPATDSSVFIAGFAGSTVAIALTDSNLPPAEGNGRYRIVNASPDAPPLDVLVNDEKVVSALAYTKASTYFEIPADTLTVKFNDSTTGATLLTLPNVALTAISVLSIYAAGPAAQLAGQVFQDNV
jgi:hypothetical protein